MSKVNIITHHTNGAGLQKDSQLLTRILTERGHEVRKIQFDDPATRSYLKADWRKADVNFFLEVVNKHMIGSAKINVVVPNSEWWSDASWASTLSKFDMVLCKTADCLRIWSGKVHPSACRLIGWAAEDRYMPEVPRQLTFVHLSGKSITKNTAVVMDAWRNFKIPHPITVSAFKPEITRLCVGIPNVTLVQRFSEDAMPKVMNTHLFHLMPSKYEGFGMAIHEALGCGGVVITTDAAPMNTFSGIPRELLIPVTKVQPVQAAQFNHVSAEGVRDSVERAMSLSDARIYEIIADARHGFLKDLDYFNKALPAALKELSL